MKLSRRLIRLASTTIVPLVILAGCASFNVRKIPNESQYSDAYWNDKKQQQADRINGFRYYLPRPYVAVKQEFPVSGGEFFVTGTVSSDDELISINTKSLSEEGKSALGTVGATDADGCIRLSTSSIGFASFSGEQGLLQRESEMNSSADYSAELTSTGTPAKAIAAQAEHLAATVSPGTMAPDSKAVSLSATIVASAPFVGKLANVQLALVPLDASGVPLPAEAIRLTSTKENKVYEADKSPGEYAATADRDTVKSDKTRYFAVGVIMKATERGKTEATEVLFHRTGYDLTVIAAPAKKGDENKEDTPPLSTVTGETSGDPTTSPLIKLDGNNFFDVLLLPDFEEQYAMKTRGIKQSVNFGFENGWMVEKANYQVDNSKLAEFLTTTAQKVLSAGAGGAPGLFGGLGKELIGQTLKDKLMNLKRPNGLSPSFEVSEVTAERTVTLKVSWVATAAPGLYPILKLNENFREQAWENPEHIEIPFRPYTRIAFNVKRTVDITAVGVGAP
ncbi:MAG: hypothetical protein JNK74_06120 [Candidatus Hydrogenedentes bacterium]|nr:hypothetical protein [Candidatus Hydrogenedentota bacterium]